MSKLDPAKNSRKPNPEVILTDSNGKKLNLISKVTETEKNLHFFQYIVNWYRTTTAISKVIIVATGPYSCSSALLKIFWNISSYCDSGLFRQNLQDGI